MVKFPASNFRITNTFLLLFERQNSHTNTINSHKYDIKVVRQREWAKALKHLKIREIIVSEPNLFYEMFGQNLRDTG